MNSPPKFTDTLTVSFNDTLSELMGERLKTDHTLFIEKIQKFKNILKQKYFELKEELNSIKFKRNVLEQNKTKKIQEFSHGNEMLLYLSALATMYESKIRSTSGEQNRYLELHNFQEEVAAKYEKQSMRLAKLKEYSSQLRAKIALTERAKLERRQQRYKEGAEILYKYEEKIREIRDNHVLSRIDQAELVSNNLDEEIEKLQSQIKIEKVTLSNQRETNNDLIKDVHTFEGAVNKRADDISKLRRQLEKSNAEASNRIIKMKNQCEDVRNEINELDELIKHAKNLRGLPSKTMELYHSIMNLDT